MRRRGDVVLTIPEAWIRIESRAQFDDDVPLFPRSAPHRYDIHRPRSLPRIVEEFGREGVGLLHHVADGGPLMTARQEIQAVAGRSMGGRPHDLPGRRGSDAAGEGLFPDGTRAVFDQTEADAHGGKAAQLIEHR